MPRPALLCLPLWLALSLAARAQPAPGAAGPVGPDASEPALSLQRTPLLPPRLPASERGQWPTFIEGQRIEGQPELEVIVEGDAVLRRGDTVLRGQRITYDQPTDTARASGQVRINRRGDVFEGPALELRVDAFEGFFTQPSFRLLRNDAYGQAERIEFVNEDRVRIRRGTYTTCQREDEASWRPAWMISAENIRIDNDTGTGVATGAWVRLYGVPVVPIPRFSFPLSEQRKSGLLPVTSGGDNINGTVFSVPYYWNIAPQRDATLTGTVMARRGVELGSEFRYLEPDFRGRLRANVLPDDRLRDGRLRWALSVEHQDRLLREPFARGMELGLRINRVSDDDYWRDFPRNGITQAQRLLASEASLNWAYNPRWSFSARALQWQTLQVDEAVIVPPYDRMPQLVARYSPGLPAGLQGRLEADFTRFNSVSRLTGQPDAQRAVLVGTVSRTWRQPGGYATPRLRLHARHYAFDSALTTTGEHGADVVVPTFSFDSGVFLERDTAFLGRDLLQTLEPRLFYVYTPYRAQTQLPNYDSGASDFNFTTIFSDNAFAGNDRISDNNLITLGVTSRFQDAGTGAQLARVGVAQRLRLAQQRVTLTATDTPATDRVSDLLVGGAVNWTPHWSTDATIQYNPHQRQSERGTINARYAPGRYRMVQGAYRFQRDANRQVDLSWQWPINDLWGDRAEDLGPGRGLGGNRWYGVGRLNLNLIERRLVDSLVGVEYDGCCWVGRAVVERLRLGSSTSDTRLMFQLELIGFSRLGDNVLGALRSQIPRYQFLREQVAPPSRYTRYD